IRKGQLLILSNAGANHDPDVYPDPEVFDIDRNPQGILTFGLGPHYCLGANLARMELRLMLREIAERLPDISLAGDISILRSNFISGVKRMPVRFTPTPSTNTEPVLFQRPSLDR
ncbi:MAG: cytochrome P450, partial [Acidimicrobiales bacterium]|nr:cytochrome P450 [Acidimicrobiales bacterium]